MATNIDDLALAAEFNAKVDLDNGTSVTVGCSDAFGEDAGDHAAKARDWVWF